MIGRREETTLLDEALYGAEEGRGGLWVLEATAGAGKTRLLQWAEERARERGFQVRWGRCQPFSTAPLFPWYQVFRRPSGVPRATGAHPPPGSAVRGRRGHPAVPERPAFSEAPGASLSWTLFRWLDELESASARGPQLLLLDDFHWADPPSCEALRFFARNVQGLPVAILLARRGDEPVTAAAPPSSASLSSILDSVEREGYARRLRIGGLREREVQELVESTLGARLAPAARRDALRHLLHLTGGIPFFVLEVLKHADPGDAVEPSGVALALPRSEGSEPEGTGRPGAAIPSAVRRLLESRLALLGPEERALLEGAAVIGEEFDAAELADVVEGEGSKVRAGVDRLIDGGWILPFGSAPRLRARFPHAILWELVRQGTDEARSQRFRGRLALRWERENPEDAERLARLWREAKEPARSLPWIRRALDPQKGELHESSLPRLTRWLWEARERQGTSPEEILSELLGILRGWFDEQGSTPALLAALDELLPRAQGTPLAWEARAFQIRVVSGLDAPRAERDFSALETELGGKLSELRTPARVDLAVVRGYIRSTQGRYEESMAESREVLRLLGDAPGSHSRLNSLRALIFALMARPDLAQPQESVTSVLEEMGRVVHRVGAPKRWMELEEDTLATVAYHRGDLVEARRAWGASLALLQRYRSPASSIALATVNVATTQLETGQAEAARKSLAEAWRLASRLGLPWLEALISMDEARVDLSEGRAMTEVVRRLQKAIPDLPREMWASQLWEGGHAVLAEALLVEDDLAGARRALDQARDPSALGAPSNIYLRMRARLHGRLGEIEKARAALQQAIAMERREGNRMREAQGLLELGRIETLAGAKGEGMRLEREGEAILRACGADLPTFRRTLDATYAARGARAPPVLGPGPSIAPSAPTTRAHEEHLSVRARLLLHLLERRATQGPEGSGAPDVEACTQAGLARGLGVRQSTLAKPLLAIEAEGLVQHATVLTRGSRRSVRTYYLTARGAKAAERLRSPAGQT